jgi:DNA helicase-2/ATP-dependent DNA helicase PcrA
MAGEPTIYLGPPGTGKTTTLLGVVDEELARGTEPERIAFISFTTKAANEARDRACARFGLDRSRFFHFRTMHSLCFRALGLTSSDVLAGKRFQEFADWAGVRVTGRAWSDDEMLEGFETGDRILFMENLARIRRVPLRALYDADDDNLSWMELDRVARALAEYKARHGLLDYTDFLTEFVRRKPRVNIDVLIGDEAQDFSALQWQVFWQLARGARRACVAGDDDQAIYAWAGADVDHLIDLKGDARVLGQSWRCPPVIQKMGRTIIEEVKHRRPKEWKARAGERGVASRVGRFEHAKLDDDWEDDDEKHERPPVLVLARNVYVLRRDVEPALRARGVVFETSTGKSSLDLGALEAAETWTRLGAGHDVTLRAARVMYEYLSMTTGYKKGNKKLPRLGEDEEGVVSGHELVAFGGLRMSLNVPWHAALEKIAPEDVSYMRLARARGERLRGRPRIRISTIHSAKGGEASHVVLMTEMAKRTAQEMEKRPDDERRVWYVGVTRAKRRITIVSPNEGRYCPWL